MEKPVKYDLDEIIVAISGTKKCDFVLNEIFL